MVVLTADHGGLDIPERNGPRGCPLRSASAQMCSRGNVGDAVAKELDIEGTALLGGEDFANDVFVSPAVPSR